MRPALVSAAASFLLVICACSAGPASDLRPSSGGGDAGAAGGGGEGTGAAPGGSSGGATGSSGGGGSGGGAGSSGGSGAPHGPGSGGSGGAVGDSAGPCTDCRVHVPAGLAAGTPARLLVALHGDEGRDLGGAAATSMVIDSWRAAADAAGFIVLAPACPTGSGCDGAWSDWLASEGYRPSNASLAWLDAQVDAIEAKYDVDLSGEYLAGYSGGAYWLGYYAQARASRFAGVAFVAGGMPAYTAFNACPSCKLPGYFLGGDGDPRTAGQMSDTASAFQACGEEIHLELVPGSHEEAIASLTTKNEAGAILTWFAARPRACP